MPNELNLIQTDAFTTQEKTELGQQIDRMIEAHKNNRQDINRLVFESIATMTEADDAQRQLDQKGTVKKFLGRLTGSNEKLQSTINTNRAAAQYAAQQTLQKLAEQNLMTFDLISAVNNKLNASMYAVGEEFTKLYAGLGKFLKHNRSEMVRMETRLAKVEKNVQLLTWQNSIEYLEFDGEEYANMDDTKKIVCLVRDFYDITKGNWSTSDLLLLKTAMSTIDIEPKSQVNYFAVLKQIACNDTLKNKLLGNEMLQQIQPSPEDLMSLSVVKKLDSLQHEEAHVVDTMAGYLEQQGVTADKQKICSDMTKNYMKKEANVNIDMDADSYDMMLDLLYNLKQADRNDHMVLSQNNKIQLGEEQKQEDQGMDKYECCICGYIYDEAEGDADDGIIAGTKFTDLPDDWVCPTCGADKNAFQVGEEQKQGDQGMDKYECCICGYIYDEAEGDPDNGVAAGTKFADLPDSWVCPTCGTDKDDFDKI